MDFGPLDMDIDEMVTCKVTIRIGNMILNF
jgi:hypothetical protein